MNRVLPSSGRSFLLIIGLFLSFSSFFGNISAQTYFILTEIETIPAAPNDQTPTSIRISGLRSNICSYLNTSNLNINASFSVLNMDWDNQADLDPMATCPNGFVSWDTTFQLGILNGGQQAFYFSGNNYGLSGVNNPTLIQVGATDCDNSNTEIAVTNTNDEGPGSLRQAIVCANAQPGFNRIVFDLMGNGPDTIRVGETSGFELPSIFDDSTFIDGTTHPGFGSNGDFSPRVVLDGQFHAWDAAINALFIRADRCAIYGLEIINFPDDAIDVLGGDDVTIGGINRGNVIHNNGLEQDFFAGNPGQGPWEGCGIVIRGGSARATIRGNYIGTNFFETTPNGNEFCGILIRDGGDLHQIGGELPGMSNTIVNNASGVIVGGGTVGCRILQNNMYCNDSLALRISSAANNGILPPVITIAENGNISGTASPNQSIALYRNDNSTCTTAPCQGGTYLGAVNVVNGSWNLVEPFVNNTSLNTGDIITAIATDITGNSSEFGDCITYTGCSVILTLDNIQATICGENNGRADLVVSGGTAPYLFTYNGQSSNNGNLTNLSPGNYAVTVTDNNNCMDEISFSILQSSSPVLSIFSQNDAACNDANGSFTLSVTGGQPPFLYTSNGATTGSSVFNNLFSGIYEVVVMDANGCTDLVTITLEDSNPPIIAISQLDQATCGQENGSLVVVASGGTAPFIYSVDGIEQNNGNFSNLAAGIYTIGIMDANTCTTQLNAVIGDSPPVNLLADEVIHPTCGNNNGQFSIETSGGTPPFEYILNDDPVAQTIFSDLFAGTYTITVNDANNCSETVEVTLENNGTDPVSSFTFELIDNQVIAQSTSVGAASLEWDFGDGGSSTANSITYEYSGSGIYTLCLSAINGCGAVTTCENIEVVLPLSDYSIGGEINRADGSGIGQVTVACTNQSDLTNDLSGDFLFAGLPQGDSYEITPTKDINFRNGVTVLDLIDLRAHLLFIDTFVTPYQYIAADINRNGSVTVFDLVQLQQIVLETIDEFPQNTSWDFLPADYTFDYASQALDYTYPQSILVDNLNTDYLTADFIGVKIGDTNESNNPSLVSSAYSPWQIEDRSVAAGEIIEIPVRMLIGEELLGFEAAINFDPTHLGFQEITGVTDYQLEEGQLKMLWYTEDDQNKALRVTPEMEWISLRFLAYTDLEKISDVINFTTPDARQLTYNAERTEQAIQWTFTDAVVTDIKSFDQRTPKLYPNPFNQQTLFTFELFGASAVLLEVFDLTGKVVLTKEENLGEGLQQIAISGDYFPAGGTYFYRLSIGTQTFRGRIIKQ